MCAFWAVLNVDWINGTCTTIHRCWSINFLMNLHLPFNTSVNRWWIWLDGSQFHLVIGHRWTDRSAQLSSSLTGLNFLLTSRKMHTESNGENLNANLLRQRKKKLRKTYQIVGHLFQWFEIADVEMLLFGCCEAERSKSRQARAIDEPPTTQTKCSFSSTKAREDNYDSNFCVSVIFNGSHKIICDEWWDPWNAWPKCVSFAIRNALKRLESEGTRIHLRNFN